MTSIVGLLLGIHAREIFRRTILEQAGLVAPVASDHEILTSRFPVALVELFTGQMIRVRRIYLRRGRCHRRGRCRGHRRSDRRSHDRRRRDGLRSGVGHGHGWCGRGRGRHRIGWHGGRRGCRGNGRVGGGHRGGCCQCRCSRYRCCRCRRCIRRDSNGGSGDSSRGGHFAVDIF